MQISRIVYFEAKIGSNSFDRNWGHIHWVHLTEPALVRPDPLLATLIGDFQGGDSVRLSLEPKPSLVCEPFKSAFIFVPFSCLPPAFGSPLEKWRILFLPEGDMLSNKMHAIRQLVGKGSYLIYEHRGGRKKSVIFLGVMLLTRRAFI